MSPMRPAAIALLIFAFAACGKTDRPPATDTGAVPPDTGSQARQTISPSNTMAFKLTSSAFSPNGSIPTKYTCEGDDTSPPLEWSDSPSGTKSFALILDDPDAPDPAKPQLTYVHWVVYNIPAGTTRLAENAARSGLPAGAMQGTNDWKKQTYGGPCPPIGRHRYFHKLYALDTDLTFVTSPTKANLEKAMQGHVLGKAELVGTYEKAKK